jgi:hypothetical protein
MVGEHLAMLYSKINCMSHKLVFYSSTQTKLKFTKFVKNNYKILIKTMEFKIMERFEKKYHP